MTLILNHDDVAGILSTAEVIDAVRAGLIEQAAGKVALPPRTTVHAPGGHGWLRVMPAILGGSRVMGYKAMHSTPKVGVRYLVALYDLANGALLAQVDADWLTAQRTAAVAALAVDTLANPSIDQCGVLGSSDQSRALLAAVASVRRPGGVKVFSPTAENRDRFAADMEAALNLSVTPVGRARDSVEGCDLVLSAFRAGPDPVISADWIAPGTHLNAGSSILPDARELEEDVWRRSATIVVDDRIHAFESGDGRNALASGAIQPDDAVELWEVLDGRQRGRRSPGDVTLFKAVGTGLQDLSVAHAVYRRAAERGLGREIGDFPRPRATR